jgi:phage/plasmid-associated DNA primase
MMNKLLIYHDEIDPDALQSATQFKALTGTLKKITGELKGVQDEVTYDLETKIIYAGNRIPTPKFVPDDAFWDRWIIIPFTQRIRGTAEDNKKFTEEKLFPETEGIIAYLMPYLSRLNELNAITKEEIRHLWYRWGESPFAFYEECNINPNISTESQELFQQYKIYCQWALLPQCTAKRFGMVMAELGISYMQHNNGYKDIIHVYDGIRMNPTKYTQILMELTERERDSGVSNTPTIEGIPINLGHFNGFNDIK